MTFVKIFSILIYISMNGYNEDIFTSIKINAWKVL